jgi:hypothetical protein
MRRGEGRWRENRIQREMRSTGKGEKVEDEV